MKEVPLAELRENLEAHLQTVSSEHAPFILKGGEGHDVVMISLEDYERLVSDHLMRSPRNAAALRESIAELDAGGGRTIDRS